MKTKDIAERWISRTTAKEFGEWWYSVYIGAHTLWKYKRFAPLCLPVEGPVEVVLNGLRQKSSLTLWAVGEPRRYNCLESIDYHLKVDVRARISECRQGKQRSCSYEWAILNLDKHDCTYEHKYSGKDFYNIFLNNSSSPIHIRDDVKTTAYGV